MKISDQPLSRGHPPAISDQLGDLAGCLVTFEDTQRELDDIEPLLALELGVAVTKVRNELLTREANGVLKHSQLIADWHQAYSSYLDWIAQTSE